MDYPNTIHPAISWVKVILSVLIFCMVCAMFYTSFFKRTEANNYQPDSKHIEIVEHNWPLSIHPCGAIFDFNQESKKVKK